MLSENYSFSVIQLVGHHANVRKLDFLTMFLTKTNAVF